MLSRSLAIACVFMILSLGVGARSRAAEPVTLRVLSYNIHHAEGEDRKLDLERIARVIREANPDLVALQEVDERVKRTSGVDQPAELARLTKMHVAFGGNIALQGGRYGNAILSRHRIVRFKNHALPNVAAGEQRGVLVAEIDVPGLKEPLVFFATHLDHRPDPRERLESAEAIRKLAESYGERRMLLAGDLNDTPDSKTLKTFTATWTQANEQPLPTIPVDRPRQQIDFVLYRPRSAWKTIFVKVLDEAVASDHRAILAQLAPEPEAP